MKKYWKLIITVVSLFVIWNLVWFSYKIFKYDKFFKDIPENEWGVHMIKKDGYVYDVIKLDYLSFTSNFNVADEQDKLVLIIWPQITGGFEYGLLINDDTGERYSIYVDEKGKPLDQADINAVQKVAEFSNGVEILFRKANEMWSLDK